MERGEKMKTASIVQAKRKLRSLGRTVLVLLLFVSVLFSGRLQATAAGKVDASVKVDLAATKQIIRGFGAASAWCGSISDTNMDILFKDMGLSILRVRIAPSEIWKAAPVLVDSGWTVELYNAKKASARGAIVIATPWTPPASMKTNNSLVGGELKPEEYANYAQYLKAFADYFTHNRVPLYAISIQNEPNIEVDYESCHWTGEQMRDFLKNHGEVFGGLRIIMPEAYNFDFRLSEPALKDPEASKYVTIIGGHLYGAMIRDYPRARREGKEVWMTEHLVNDQSLRAALDTAKEIHDCLTIGNMNAYIWWWVISDANGFLNKQYLPQKRGYVVGQFARFVRPGYYRVEATSRPAANVHVTAYKGDGKVVIVAINRRRSPVDLEFTLENGKPAEVFSWVTTAEDNIAPGPALAVSGGSFRAGLPAQSVTTFVGELLAPGVMGTPAE
jgi:glucuronoarabinoxylan endo-1,4-beta-xylanase